MAARYPISPFDTQVTPSADATGRFRNYFRTWLRQAGATEREQFDLLVAAGEAVANALEHPVTPDLPAITVRAERRDSEIEVTISDSGRWRTQPRSGFGGYGLPLMRSLTDRVEMHKSESGSTVILTRRLGGRNVAFAELGRKLPSG